MFAIKLVRAALLAACVAIPAAAQSEEKSATGPAAVDMTVGEALSALMALRALDGQRAVILRAPDGSTSSVLQPWEFKSAELRLTIARDIRALAAMESDVEATRVKIVTEVFKGAQPKPDTPEMTEFLKRWGAVLKAPANVVGVTKIDPKDLRLDINEIGSGVLVWLAPILLNRPRQ